MRPFLLVGIALLALAHPARGADHVINRAQLTESSTLPSLLSEGDTVSIRGTVSETGAVTHSLTFSLSTTSIFVRTAWFSPKGTKTRVRLHGVAVELVDSTDTVEKTATFRGVVAGVAVATLAANRLTPGADYELQLFGTSAGLGEYVMVMQVGR